MTCDCGHIMTPLCEYRPDENGNYYVVFKCVGCGKTNKMDYREYAVSRQSCTCSLCGKKFWGSAIENCNQCGLKLPRVPGKSWSSVQLGSDDCFVGGWSDPGGHYYTLEELKASGILPGLIRAYFQSGSVLLKKWLDADLYHTTRLLDSMGPYGSDSGDMSIKKIVDTISFGDIFEAIFRPGNLKNAEQAEKPPRVKKNRRRRKNG